VWLVVLEGPAMDLLERLLVLELRLDLSLRVEVAIARVARHLAVSVDRVSALFLFEPVAVEVRGGHVVLLSAGAGISG
jgi:hypothetical protein